MIWSILSYNTLDNQLETLEFDDMELTGAADFSILDGQFENIFKIDYYQVLNLSDKSDTDASESLNTLINNVIHNSQKLT